MEVRKPPWSPEATIIPGRQSFVPEGAIIPEASSQAWRVFVETIHSHPFPQVPAMSSPLPRATASPLCHMKASLRGLLSLAAPLSLYPWAPGLFLTRPLMLPAVCEVCESVSPPSASCSGWLCPQPAPAPHPPLPETRVAISLLTASWRPRHMEALQREHPWPSPSTRAPQPTSSSPLSSPTPCWEARATCCGRLPSAQEPLSLVSQPLPLPPNHIIPCVGT